jgi:uncharacterized protein
MPRMGRPVLERRVEFIPQVTYFKPSGVPMIMLEEIRLSVEELEAMRLKDIEGMEQEECAQNMGISRSTFARILTSARQKAADALLHGKAIKIEGGNFQPAFRKYICEHGHEWERTAGNDVSMLCPVCGAAMVSII